MQLDKNYEKPIATDFNEFMNKESKVDEKEILSFIEKGKSSILPEDRDYMRYLLAKEDTKQLKRIASDLAEQVSYYQEAGKTLFVGIGGHPRSGKTQFTQDIAALLKENYNINACIVRMNAYRNMLHCDELKNAYVTFDSNQFVYDVMNAKAIGKGNFPTWNKDFQRAIPDQVEYDSNIHQIVLVEGLYVLLEREPWNSLPFGQTYFFDFTKNVVSQRHVTNEILDENDLENASFIKKHVNMKKIDKV